MILCDRCDNAFHPQCLNPPLQEIPDEDWVCDICENQLMALLRKKGKMHHNEE